jgi:hypothetical protein
MQYAGLLPLRVAPAAQRAGLTFFTCPLEEITSKDPAVKRRDCAQN